MLIPPLSWLTVSLSAAINGDGVRASVALASPILSPPARAVLLPLLSISPTHTHPPLTFSFFSLVTLICLLLRELFVNVPTKTSQFPHRLSSHHSPSGIRCPSPFFTLANPSPPVLKLVFSLSAGPLETHTLVLPFVTDGARAILATTLLSLSLSPSYIVRRPAPTALPLRPWVSPHLAIIIDGGVQC